MFEENLAWDQGRRHGVKPVRVRGKCGGKWTPWARLRERSGSGCAVVTGAGSIPIGEDFFRFSNLLLGAGESEFQFSRLARDLNFDGFKAVAFHAGAELFVGFVEAVFLEAIAHG